MAISRDSIDSLSDFDKTPKKTSGDSLKQLTINNGNRFKYYTKAGVAVALGVGLILGASIGTRDTLQASTNKSAVLMQKGKDEQKGEVLKTLTDWVSRSNKINYAGIEDSVKQYMNYIVNNRNLNIPGDVLNTVTYLNKMNKRERATVLPGKRVNNPTNFIISFPTEFYTGSGLPDWKPLNDVIRCNSYLTTAEFIGMPAETISAIQSQLTVIKQENDPFMERQEFERFILTSYTEVRAGNDKDIPAKHAIKSGDITFWMANDLMCICVPDTYKYQDVSHKPYDVEKLTQIFGK